MQISEYLSHIRIPRSSGQC